MSNILILDFVFHLERHHGNGRGAQVAIADLVVLVGNVWWHITITHHMSLNIFVMEMLSKCRENRRMNVYHPSLSFNSYQHFINLVISPPSTTIFFEKDFFIVHCFLEMFSRKFQTSCHFILFHSASQVRFFPYIMTMPLSHGTKSMIII